MKTTTTEFQLVYINKLIPYVNNAHTQSGADKQAPVFFEGVWLRQSCDNR